MTGQFRRCTITKVPRNENAQADALAWLASSCVIDTPSETMVRTIGPSVNSIVLALAPNWERPYRVIDIIRDETYTLATMEGRVLPRTWHIIN
ncbi:hypothetical protein BHM03_00016886 [Ensete ventricosum]|nr:hypothetical protein BHM03_00016886 [Ensete ventricosum]